MNGLAPARLTKVMSMLPPAVSVSWLAAPQ